MTAIHKDSYGNLWLGTYEGLYCVAADKLAAEDYRVQKFVPDATDPYSLKHHRISSLFEDSLGFLWVGTYQGLHYLDLRKFPSSRRFDRLTSTHGLVHWWVPFMSEIRRGEYWLGTYDGLQKMYFNPRKDQQPRLEDYFPDPDDPTAFPNLQASDIATDRFGETWLLGRGGLSKVVEGDGKIAFENYENDPQDTTSLSSNSLTFLHLDGKGRLWIGSRLGLNLLIQEEGEALHFRSFGVRDGFPNSVIQSIGEDDRGHLWLGTNRGLVQFDPEAALAGEPSVLGVYSKQDGLPSNEHEPPVYFTQLKVLNQTVAINEGEEPLLPFAISMTDSLLLRHDQNIFSLEFAALDFTRPTQNEYRYQLRGFDPDWISNGTRNSVTYTNLPPGDYVLAVQGSNNDGLWAETPRELFIRILPPWWKTWWAYSIYTLIFFALLYGFIQWRTRQEIAQLTLQNQIIAARREERATLRKKNAADVHDELGNRFTKISLFLELAERELQADSKLHLWLKKIRHNSLELADGVRDLIWSLDPEQDSLNGTLLRLQEFGDRLFDYSSIDFKTKGLEAELTDMDLDPELRRNLLLLFKEAMNNCLKYSEAENAYLEVKQGPSHLLIQFSDDGQGFVLEEQQRGNGLKNMRERAQRLGTELIITSTPGAGTKIGVEITHMG